MPGWTYQEGAEIGAGEGGAGTGVVVLDGGRIAVELEVADVAGDAGAPDWWG